MGKGTGEVDSYIYNIKKGEIILEVLFNGLISEKLLVDILLVASNKLPIAIKINSKCINRK
jgi:ribosomal protein L16/L10AE